MKLKPRLLDFLSNLAVFHDRRQRKALIDYVGFGHLARHIDWEGEAVTFVAQLVGVFVSRGQADLVDFIKGLAESDWFGLEIQRQLQGFQGEISALDAKLWRSEFEIKAQLPQDSGGMKQDNRDKSTGFQTNVTGGNVYNAETININEQKSPESEPKRLGPPHNLPYSGVSKFVGRSTELENLHQQLQRRERVAISAIAGMGGIGKTELALQYAQLYWQENYPGGVCWLIARDVDLGTQIISFARKKMKLSVPQKLDDQPLNLEEQAQWCWENWQPPDKSVLVILDDVTDYENIKPYLPPNEPRFKIIITTRKQSLAESFELLSLEILSEAAAVELLESLIGEERVRGDVETRDLASLLCEWLGYLPLGLELVGRYLKRKKDVSLTEMLSRLEKQHLEQRSLTQPTATMTAQKGVAAAFELSWLELDEDAQQLGCLLSLFANAPIEWELVEMCCLFNQYSGKLEELSEEELEEELSEEELEEELSEEELEELEKLEDIRDDFLLNLNLLQRTDEGIYQLHQLIREFLQGKMELYDGADELKRGFCQTMVAVAKEIPDTPILEEIAAIAPAIPHVTEAATVFPDWLSDEDLYWPFIGLGRFYEGQGAYDQALPWLEQCLDLTRNRLGSEHPSVADSLNNLALLYSDQGRYEKAEPLYVQALDILERKLGANHPNTVTIRGNLQILRDRTHQSEPNLWQKVVRFFRKSD